MTVLSRPRGAALVVALVALMIVTALGGILIRTAFLRLRQVQQAERTAQSLCLVEAGLDRARARLAAEADYQGETWEIAPDRLGGKAPAIVTITVEPVEGQPGQRRVAARAEYPRGATLRARNHRQITMTVGRKPATGETP